MAENNEDLKKEIEEPDWQSWLLQANSCLSSPLSDSDMQTIIRSVSRR